MTYPPEWPAPGKMHFRLVHDQLGWLDLDCDKGYVVTGYNLGFPEIREVKMPNSLDDGTFDVTRFFGARSVSLDVVLKPHVGLTPASYLTAPEAQLRDKLLGYLYPGIRSRLLFSEHDDKRVRQILLRGANASLGVNQRNYNRLSLSWIAPRGTLYSYDERCYSFRFGETSGEFQDLIIVNEGTVPVDWRATISGYSVHPQLILDGTEVLRLSYDADPGDVITLDSFSRTITINGKPASYAYVADDTVWFKIPPGSHTLRVQHQGGVSAYGYPYARWQVAASSGLVDLFERADGPLGADWEIPVDLPAGTVQVPLVVDAGAVIVTVPDNGVGPHEWGFARHATPLSGGVGEAAEIEVSNLAQSSGQGPIVRGKAELYTHMNDADAACQALSVDFDYGITATPVAPVVYQDPFETVTGWDVLGSGASLVPGRTGTGMQVTGSRTSLNYNMATGASIVVVGFAFRITGVTGTTAISSIHTLLELRGAAGAILHGTVAVASGGSLYATDATGTNRGGSDLGTVLPNVWHYAEIRYLISDTAGEFALRLDGVDVASAYGLDTSGGAPNIDQFRIPATSGFHTYDDFYIAAGTEAVFIGPLAVPNGSLGWEMHQYAADGSPTHTVASGAVPYDYSGTTRLRLESGTDGLQRFLLNGHPVAEAVEDDPVVGTLVGFGASYETFTYEAGTAGFTDEFERTTLGADWALPVARSANKVIALPTITTGAAVTASHSGSYPQQVYSAATTGATLAGGVAQTMPSNLVAGYMCIARVLQTDPAGVPITASTGWTQLGTASIGNPAGDFMESFDHYGAWFTAGAATTVAGRTGNAARITGVASSNHVDFTLRPEHATTVIGFAHQISSLVAATSEIVQWYSDTNATQHNRLTVASNGSLSFWRGTTNLGTTGAGLITVNTWNYIEVMTTLSDTVGAVTVRLNGSDVLLLTAQDTQNAGTKTVYDTVRLCGPIASMFNTFDDCYVKSGAAAAFKGDQIIPVSSGTEYIRMSAFARFCDSTSNDILTLTGAATAFATHIESYYVQPSGFTAAIIPQIKYASATGVTGTADPPSVDLGLGTKDWMFLTSGGYDTQASASVTGSSGYSNIHGTTMSPNNLCALRSGTRTATASGTENPAAFTGSTTGRPWIAMTFAFPGGDIKWGGAENTAYDFDPAQPISVEALVNVAGTTGNPTIELYSHMVTGSSACRVLQVDLIGRTWRMGHYEAVDGAVIAASGSLPTGAVPFTLRLEGDPDGTERFLFNGTLVQSILDATAPTPTVPVHVGFGEFWTTAASSPGPQVRSLTATGAAPIIGGPPPEPESPRIERFAAQPMSGTDWAYTGVGPPNNPPPGGKPPWAWTPPVDPITGEPSILSVHFCYYDQWL